MDINNLINKCHTASRTSGWWTNISTGRPIDPWSVVVEKIALCHSEVTEAYVADLHTLFDDKLPHRLGVEVELADVVIRAADLLGALFGDASFFALPNVTSQTNAADNLLDIHAALSDAVEAARKNKDITVGLLTAIQLCLNTRFTRTGVAIDVGSAIQEKLDFNAVRPDHKLDNRMQEGGKKF